MYKTHTRRYDMTEEFNMDWTADCVQLTVAHVTRKKNITRNQAVARIADRTAKNCRGHVT